MRHRSSASNVSSSAGPGEVPVAVGDMGGVVGGDAGRAALPEDVQPPVAHGSPGGVVGLAAGASGVVEVAVVDQRSEPCEAVQGQPAREPGVVADGGLCSGR